MEGKLKIIRLISHMLSNDEYGCLEIQEYLLNKVRTSTSVNMSDKVVALREIQKINKRQNELMGVA